jgi:hypothetical protein
MSPITRPATAVAVVLLLAAIAPAGAARDPDDRCAAAIQRASGRLANCLLRSEAGLVVSDNANRYVKKAGGCEAGFARDHRHIIGRYGAAHCPEDSAAELGDTVFRSTALVSAAVTEGMDGGRARLGPMMAPVKGMNYEPAPSNYVPGLQLYYDTDFYNQDFVQLWGPGTLPAQPNGRDDVADMASLGINFIRVFNWNPGEPGGIPLRNHRPWLDYVARAASKRMYVGAVFANGLRATDAATMVVDQFNGFSAETRAQVAVWLIGNEIAPDDPFTAQTLAVIKAKAQPPLDTLPICVPFQMSSTADALAKVQRSHAQFAAAGVADRFIACFNFYGLGQAPATRTPADQLQDFIEGFFADDFVKTNHIELLLTEFGINFDGSSGVQPNAGGDAALQGRYLGEMLARSAALQAKYPRFLGQTIFEYTNETWKTPLTEQRFGLYELQAQAAPFTGRTTAAAAYPVDTRVARPQHTAVVDNY